MRTQLVLSTGLLLGLGLVTTGCSDRSAATSFPADLDPDRAPPSPWIVKERTWALGVLASARADVVVAPFQVQERAFDVVERNLLARSLAEGLTKAHALTVADMTLVERALGSGARTFSDEDVFAVAERVGARTVVLGFLGHDGAGTFDLRVEVVRLEEGKPTAGGRRIAGEMDDVAFGDVALPYDAFVERRGELLAALAEGLTRSGSLEQQQAGAAPPSPSSRAPARRAPHAQGLARQLQLLGALHPTGIHDRPRERLFERSLVAVEDLPDSDLVRVLKARALANLHRRPAALAALGDLKSKEAMALAAYLDGSVDRLAPLVAEIDDPIQTLMATIELERLKRTYELVGDPEAIERIAAQEPTLELWLRQALAETDIAAGHSSALVKAALDAHFPDSRFALDTLVRNSGGRPAERHIAKLAVDHLAALRDQNAAWWLTDGVGEGDFVDLAEQMLIANVVVPARRDWTRGRNAAATLRLTSDLEPLFAGHPEFAIVLGHALVSAEDTPGVERLVRRELGMVSLRHGALWSQGQSSTMQMLTALHSVYLPGSDKLGPPERARVFFDDDWPSRAGWEWLTTGRTDDLAQCVAYTIDNADCLFALYAEIASDDAEAARALVAANDQRFAGHPRLGQWRAGVRDHFNESPPATVAALDGSSTDWQVYRAAGMKLAKEGKPREALEVFSRYPGFDGGGGSANPIVVGNYAYDAGSILFWAGAYEEARPLLEISATLRTGSNANISSAVRLALIAGSLESAAGGTVERVRRYGDQYSLRDLLLYFSIFGEKAAARRTLGEIDQKLVEPEIWLGILAVHRAEAASTERIADWAFEGQRSTLRTRLDSLPLRHVFMSQVVDRKITGAAVDTLRAHDPGPHVTRRLGGRIETNGQLEFTVQAHYREWIAWSLPEGVESMPIDSRLAMAAAGLAALEAGDEEAAYAVFLEESATYELREFLPYFAWASALVGDTARIEGYLGKISEAKAPEQTDGILFDEYLSYAVLHGARGEHDRALQYLVKANADVLYTGDRAFMTRYQILDIAERLYRHANEPAYRSWLVDLARRSTVIDPGQSWAHAFVGLYGDDSEERRLALARALYLDPLSHRASLAPEPELEAAREIAARGNPFL